MARSAPARRYAWRANDAAGLGHAIARENDVRAACGAQVVRANHAWPVLTRCGACARLVDPKGGR